MRFINDTPNRVYAYELVFFGTNSVITLLYESLQASAGDNISAGRLISSLDSYFCIVRTVLMRR
jgi:hypothetical protein